MALARRYQKTIPIPHEPGNVVTIKRVRRDDLQRAADVRQKRALDKVRDLGGPAFMRELREVQATTVDTSSEPAAPRTADKFDIDVLLAHGIVAWSGPQYDGEEVTADTIAELDPQTAEFLADAIDAYSTGSEVTEGNA